MPCSRYALQAAMAKVNPPFESNAWATFSSSFPVNPDAVMTTNVLSLDLSVNTHSTGVGHSITIRWFGSRIFAVTSAETPYMSQYHLTTAPGLRTSLPRVNQNWLVTAGST